MHTHPHQNIVYDKPGMSLSLVIKFCFQINLKSSLKLKGEQLGTAEATETFFAMTKLFQSRDIILRRMVYLGIKVELIDNFI